MLLESGDLPSTISLHQVGIQAGFADARSGCHTYPYNSVPRCGHLLASKVIGFVTLHNNNLGQVGKLMLQACITASKHDSTTLASSAYLG